MEIEESCLITKKGEFSVKNQEYLFLLYEPLIKKDACGLYGLLSSLEAKHLKVDTLLVLFQGHLNRFEKARRTLEQFDLLKSYYNQEKKMWLLQVQPCLSADHFFQHDTFSRFYLSECGSKHYDIVKRIFCDENEQPGFVDQSEKFDPSVFETWTNEKEESFLKLQPSVQEPAYDFDFETLFKGADRIFPMRYRTKENLTRIASLASVHGISPEDMRRYIQRSINPTTHVFDFEKLKRQVYANRKIMDPVSNVYQLPPVQFLKQKQKQAPVANADKKLIEKMMMDYGFSNEVMNVLIEHCLESTNQQFSRNYVEKVAANWVRLNINTKEKALAEIKVPSNKKKNKKKQDLPDWYQDTKEEKVKDDLLEQAMRLQQQLKGE